MGLSYQSPPTHWELPPGEIHLWLVPLAASPTGIARFERSLAPGELERADRFRTTALREAFVIARGTLRAILGRCLDLAPIDVALDYGEHGKPRIAGGDFPRFNLSHSGERALFAVSADREVGVDLEKVHPMDDCEQIARRYFSPAEVRDLLSLPTECRNEAFFTCWTRKEAYIKAVGTGLSLDLAGFRVSLLAGEPAILDAPADPRPWSLYDASSQTGYAAALVAEGEPSTLRAWRFGDSEACARYFE